MVRIIPIVFFILINFVPSKAHCQSFTVNDLIKLGNLPTKDIDNYMNRRGFVLVESKSDSGTINATFKEKRGSGKKAVFTKRSLDVFIKDDAKCFTLHTPEQKEFLEGEERLIKAGYFYDTLKDVKKASSILFEKANISIKSDTKVEDSIPDYMFSFKEKAVPSSLKYAEDLLQFDSHAFLVSFFGEQNVKKDMYYLTEKELKKCSVLFSGTPHQVVFVWGNDVYLNDLSYILVSNFLPTEGCKNNDPLSRNNEWQLKNGIYPGMELKDLLKINEVDFDIYGNKSELAFLAKPNELGKVDFRKTAVMLTCHECYDNKIFNQKEVSALQVAKANLPMKVFDVVLYR